VIEGTGLPSRPCLCVDTRGWPGKVAYQATFPSGCEDRSSPARGCVGLDVEGSAICIFDPPVSLGHHLYERQTRLYLIGTKYAHGDSGPRIDAAQYSGRGSARLHRGGTTSPPEIEEALLRVTAVALLVHR